MNRTLVRATQIRRIPGEELTAGRAPKTVHDANIVRDIARLDKQDTRVHKDQGDLGHRRHNTVFGPAHGCGIFRHTTCIRDHGRRGKLNTSQGSNSHRRNGLTA
eukprot:5860075-Prymnesium_polylepis.1